MNGKREENIGLGRCLNAPIVKQRHRPMLSYEAPHQGIQSEALLEMVLEQQLRCRLQV